MKKVSRSLRVSALLVSLLLPAVTLGATPEETAAARTAAQVGLEAYNKGSYAEALDLLERAESLLHAPSHLLFQARCHVQLGNLVRAKELYIKVAREPLAADAPQAFRDAQKTAQDELPALEARVPYVTIVVKGQEAKEAEVKVDDTVLAKAIIGIPYPINPGKHVITAKTPSSATASAELTIQEAKKERVELALNATAAAAPEPPMASTTAPVSPAPPPSGPESDRGTTQGAWMKPAGWAAIGVGVVGVGLGTVMYLKGSSKKSDANSQYDDCSQTSTGCSDEQLTDIDKLDSDAASAGVFSAVGFALGGVGLAGGITLLVLAPKRAEHAGVMPYLTPNSLGLTGRF